MGRAAITTWWEFLPTSTATRMWGPMGAPPGGEYSSRPSRLPRRATAPMGWHHSGGRWMREKVGAAIQNRKGKNLPPRLSGSKIGRNVSISASSPHAMVFLLHMVLARLSVRSAIARFCLLLPPQRPFSKHGRFAWPYLHYFSGGSPAHCPLQSATSQALVFSLFSPVHLPFCHSCSAAANFSFLS